MTFGQGQGLKGYFLGIDCPYENAGVVIQPIPFDLTSTYGKGADKGPDALIEASRNLELYDIETRSEPYKIGIHTASPLKAKSSDELRKKAYQTVKKHLKEKKFVVSLGGDHSISYGAIKAHAEKYGSLTILQFDAHADLYPSYENNPWSHASVMLRVREIPQVAEVVTIGLRSLSTEELPYLLRGTKMMKGPLYITFDLDAFDSSLMPSTGTPEPGGLMWNETMKLLKSVIGKHGLAGFDIVELCPIPGLRAPDYLAAKLLYKILAYKYENT
jgi:agmatinase